MARHPKPPSPNPPPRPPPDWDLGAGFDPVAEWLVDFEQTMSGELGAKGLVPAEESAVGSHAPEAAAACDDAGTFRVQAEAANESAVVSPAPAEPTTTCEDAGSFRVEAEPVEKDVSLHQSGSSSGEQVGLDEMLAPDQLPASEITDWAANEGISEGTVPMEMAAATATPVDVEMAVPSKEGGGGGNEEEESSEGESESSEEEDGSSEASSSSEEDEEQSPNKGEESSETSSCSDEEEVLGAKKNDGNGAVEGNSIEALLEEGELMVESDEDEEPKGPIKSKHEAEVLPPVPKIEILLEPHHQTLPVGTISAVMGERVIVEGSVQHNPLNEGSILWITESRTPLGIIDELFGPVKNPYYLVRYNSEEEVPAGASMGTSVSFVMEFADHILNMKELYAKGYDESGDYDEEQTDEPAFSDDEKEAEYKRSLRQAKRQTDRQHEPKKPFGDKKRSQPRGPGFWKDMQSRNRETPTPGHLSQPRFHNSNVSPAVAENMARPFEPQNTPISAPAMLPSVPINHAMPSTVQLANQMGGCFINPAQQFMPQPPNMAWPDNGIEATVLAANFMQNLLVGANQFQQQLQSRSFGTFPNQMPMPFLQFMPQTGMPANPMPFGGAPMNPPFGPPPQMPMGQGNFGQPPPHMVGDRQEQGHPLGFPGSSQGFANPTQPQVDGSGHSPTQFNSVQFNQGSPSFGGRRPQQRGGRNSSGRGGGRGGRHRR